MDLIAHLSLITPDGLSPGRTTRLTSHVGQNLTVIWFWQTISPTNRIYTLSSFLRCLFLRGGDRWCCAQRESQRLVIRRSLVPFCCSVQVSLGKILKPKLLLMCWTCMAAITVRRFGKKLLPNDVLMLDHPSKHCLSLSSGLQPSDSQDSLRAWKRRKKERRWRLCSRNRDVKGKTSGDTTRKCSKGSTVTLNNGWPG